MQYITRKGSFDAAHRMLNERVKCFNIHGHTFLYELTFSFEQPDDLGYALDFKEIKRLPEKFIEDYFDHAYISNPADTDTINFIQNVAKTKLWVMSLNGINYCNPSAENISKELFLVISNLMDSNNIHLSKIRLYETPNCWVECDKNCITLNECNNFNHKNGKIISEFKEKMGSFEYDDRKLKK